jgi:phospholipid transport system transporter-binding protein
MSEAFDVQRSDDQCLVSGVLDFVTARQALDRLGSMVRGTDQLHISFGQLTKCNSAALSLMIELKGIARRSGHQVTFAEVPDGLRQLAKVCQVDVFLD